METNEEKRKKFMENAGKRVNKVLHDIQILEPMSRSSVYDFTQNDVEEMFGAMQEALDLAKAEYNKKFEEKSKSEKRTFSFGRAIPTETVASSDTIVNSSIEELFNQFIEAVKNLPKKDLDTIYDNLQEMEKKVIR